MNPLIKLAIAMLLFYIAAVVFLSIKLNQNNAGVFQAYGTILAALVGIPALLFVGYQALQLRNSVNQQKQQTELQREEFALEHRPYLFVELQLIEKTMIVDSPDETFRRASLQGIWPKDTVYFGGGDLYFRNAGRDPATITKTEYRVRSDVRRDLDMVKWFKDEYGGFPDVTSVMPGQKNLRVPCHPIIGNKKEPPKLLFVGAVISYTGPQKEGKYWYKYSQLYVVEFKEIELDGKKLVVPLLHPHVMDTHWDRNEGEDPPSLEDPSWDELLEKSYIKTLTDKNR